MKRANTLQPPTAPHSHPNPPKLSKAISMQQMGERTFTQISHLVPKHLAIRINKSISIRKRNEQIEETIAEKMAKEKAKFIKPLNDVQLIMRKFDQVSQDKKQWEETPRPNLRLQKKSLSQLDKRIKTLLSLPTVKTIKQRVQREKTMLEISEPQSATIAIFKQASRRNLLNQYDQYIKKAIRPVNRRVKSQYQE